MATARQAIRAEGAWHLSARVREALTRGRGRPWPRWAILATTNLAIGAVLIAAVEVGVRVPGLEFLRPLRGQAALDYSARQLGEFSQLRPGFVADALGVQLPAEGRADVLTPTRRGSAGSNRPVVEDTLQRASIPPLSNDSFSQAAVVSGIPYEGRTRTMGASRQGGEPRSCGNLQGGTVWFRFRPSRDVGLIANTLGSSYGTALAVYTGTNMGSLRSVGCEASATGNAVVAFAASASSTYFFQVGATLGPGGNLVFHLLRQASIDRVSVSSSGRFGDGSSRQAIVSGDGRHVAFISTAHTFVAGAGPTKCWDYPVPPSLPVVGGGGILAGDSTCHQMYVHDRTRHLTALVSKSSSGEAANAGALNGALSRDGRFIAFESAASNLVQNDRNECASNYLMGHGGKGCVDVFVHDRVAGRTKRVSVSSTGAEAAGGSTHPSISADGRFVAFESEAPNLVVGDALTCVSIRAFHVLYPKDNDRTVGCLDVFVNDGATGRTELISVSTLGLAANGPSWGPSVSADGRFVAFSSAATNLIPNDTNYGCVQVPHANCADVFVRDRLLGTTTKVSVSSKGTQGDGDSWGSRFGKNFMSDDGRYVAFYSWATNLVPRDTNNAPDIFVHDRVTHRTVRASVASGGRQVRLSDIPRTFTISGNGRFVAFHGKSADLAPGDTDTITDVYVHDLWTLRTIVASVSATGKKGDAQSSYPTLSSDGQIIAFSSDATNLVPQENTDNNRLCGNSPCNDVYAAELLWMIG